MKEIGLDYGIFDQIGKFPYAIVDLMDIFSIDRKYILEGGLFKDGFATRLTDTSATYSLSTEDQTSSYIEQIISGDAISDYTLDSRILDEELYDSMRTSIFRDMILGNILQTVNVDVRKNGSASTITKSVYVFPAAIRDRRSGAFLRDSSIQEFKKKNDITVDQVAIVDRIEDGYDKLEMY